MKPGRICIAILVAGTVLTSSYAGPVEDRRAQWADPQLVQRINDGIEQNRKGDAVVQVVDSAGKPVSGIEISAVQQTHAFLFGANLFVLGQLATPELNAKYEKAFTGLFNFASIPFYWQDLEPESGKLRFEESAPYIWRRPPPDVLVKWCKANGITPKGHPLLWHAINPSWMPKDPEALHAAYVKRFKEIADRYAKDIPIWDTVNESLVRTPNYPLFSEDRAYVPWAFARAHEVFGSNNLLMINEVMDISHQPLDKNRYYQQVDALLKAGAGIQGVGFQFHYFSREIQDKGYFQNPDMAPSRLLDLYDGFGAFGLPLFVTEITISGAGDDGPALQAETVANLYRLWFSAKKMAGITWWNLADKTAYGDENAAMAGLIDEAGNPKPAYEALDKLINHEWKTNFAGKTDAEGKYAFRGFAGKYAVKITAADGRTKQYDLTVEPGKEQTSSFTCEP